MFHGIVKNAQQYKGCSLLLTGSFAPAKTQQLHLVVTVAYD